MTKSKAPRSKALSSKDIKDVLSETDKRLLVLEESVAMYQREVKALKDEIKKYMKEDQKESSGRKRLNEYFFVDDLGVAVLIEDTKSEEDAFRFSIGNYFRTEEEAEEYVKVLQITQELRDLAEELNDNIDAPDYLCKICFSQAQDDLAQVEIVGYVDISSGEIYCNDRNFLWRAVQRIGKANLIKAMVSTYRGYNTWNES